MGTRFSLVTIKKELVTEPIVFNQNTNLAFNTHLSNKAEFNFCFDKYTLMGICVNMFEQTRDDFHLDPEDVCFSTFITKELITDLIVFMEREFLNKYENQPNGYYELDAKERVMFGQDTERFEKFIKDIDFDTHYAIITYM
jgi:hypothetical protein